MSSASGHDSTRALNSFPTRRSSDLPASGGTWLAANDAGLALAVLNVNPPERDREALRPTRSRGEVIPALLARGQRFRRRRDRKSTRLNSSHVRISYAVFCLKKKNTH